MVFSRFNNVVDAGEDVIVYNSITGAVIKIPKARYDLANQDLIKMGFVVKQDDDIYSYSYFYNNSIYKTEELNIVIATSLNCNLSCVYCFEKNARSDKSITPEVIESIYTFINKKKHLPIHITWFGGEPMLQHKAISNLSEKLLQEDGLKFDATMITNGTIMPDDFIDAIDRYHIKSLQITLDGTEKAHDSKRFFKTGKGSFQTIINNIKRLLERTKATIIIKVNVDRNNIIEFDNLRNYIKDNLQVDYPKERVLLTTNFVRNKTDFIGAENCLSCSEYFDFLIAHGAPYRIPTLKGVCPLRKQGYYVIGPDGSICKCLEHLGKDDYSIGNISKFETSRAKQSRLAFANSPLTDPVCSQCSILPICGGGCPNERENLRGPYRPCPAEKFRLNDIIKNLYEKK
ncbi:MAG: SPASM domain-containing protein [Muribaculaceae bacterium]|nr:SPASM domain-containing protein [Muribaculaceae bacterium]